MNKILIILIALLLIFNIAFQAYAETINEVASERVIDPNKPMVALTFDDGPSEHTSAILEVLKENSSVATFFVLGSKVKTNKELLNQMIEEGSEIGNHSYNHADLTKISDYDLYRQLVGTDDLLRQNVGYTPKVMRPPYGFIKEDFKTKVHLPIILWSLDTLDWKHRDAEIVSQNILANVKDGDIILMHDIYDTTAQAVEIVVPELIERGYQLVTVSELYEYRQTPLISGNIYNKIFK